MDYEIEIYIEDGFLCVELINDERVCVAVGHLDLEELAEALDGYLNKRDS